MLTFGLPEEEPWLRLAVEKEMWLGLVVVRHGWAGDAKRIGLH